MSEQGSFDRFFQCSVLAGFGALELYIFSDLLKSEEINWFLAILFAGLGFLKTIIGLIGIMDELSSNRNKTRKVKECQ